MPRRLDGGDAEPEYVDSWNLYYCLQYYEALDLIVNSIQSRFDQPGFTTYRNLEDLLIRAVNGEDYEEPLMFTTSFYQDDLDVS